MPKLDLDAIPQLNATGYPDIDMKFTADGSYVHDDGAARPATRVA